MKKDDEEDGLQEKEEAKVEGRSPKRARVEAKEVADIPSTSEATERASASESTPSFGFGGGFAGFAALKSSGSGFGSTASIASGAGGFAVSHQLLFDFSIPLNCIGICSSCGIISRR
uniref:Uncharacterized protein n=1 Tax=Aureoumbra lagunensis TaxID=44058 RepID=A0A6S8B8L3_9STRA